MKKLILLFILLNIVCVSTSCATNSSSVPKSVSKSETNETINQSQVSKVTDNSGSNTIIETPKKEIKDYQPSNQKDNIGMTLDEKIALSLRNEAFDHYTNAKNGGVNCTKEELNIPANDEGYYFFCSDLSTLEKLNSYLSEVFTDEIAQGIISSLHVKVIKNKLTYLEADGGSMNDWGKATVKLKKKEGNDATFEFLVPSVDGTGEDETVVIDYRYIDNVGWRISTKPSKLK